MKRKLMIRSFVTGLSLLALVSCGGSSSDDEAPEAGTCESSQTAVTTASFDQLWTHVFSKQCTACHGVASDTQTANGPDMQTADAFYTSLVGKKGTDYPNWRTFQDNRERCESSSFIQSGNANLSMVTAVLDSSVTLGECRVKYHVESPQNVCITAGNLAKLKEWINAGAAR